jgi:hypothetical protein
VDRNKVRGAAAYSEGMPEESFVLDPRDFITSPFTTCPFCGQEEFGLLMVRRYGYVKRCRGCMKDEQYALPPVEKKILYLDQFAISNLMKVLHPEHRHRIERRGAAEERYWLALFDRVERLVKLHVLVCPYSDAHWEESLLAPHNEELRRIYEHLGGDVRFEDPGMVKDGQVLRAFEAWLDADADRGPVPRRNVLAGSTDGWRDRLQIEARLDLDPGFPDELRAARTERHEGLGRAVGVWRSGGRRGFEAYFRDEVVAYGEYALQAYGQRLQAFGEVMAGRRQPDDDLVFATRSQILIYQMKEKLTEHGVPVEKQIAKLRSFFASEAMQQIPSVRIAAGMFAVYAVKASLQQAADPNRGMVTDINIVSTYLPYCDAMFIDDGCADLLAEADRELSLGYPARIFSGRSRDELLEWLDELENSVEHEHIKLVERVYGPGWLTPFREIFTGAD